MDAPSAGSHGLPPAPRPLEIDRSSSSPVYRQVFEYFRNLIQTGALGEGQRMPSIRVLERELGVARESVKRAMGDLATAGFAVKVQGKGTFVASRPRTGRFWGLVVPFYSEAYNKMIVTLRREAESEGATLEHACDYDNWRRQVEIVNDFVWRGAEGLIVVPTRDEPRALPSLRQVARHRSLLLFDHTSIASQIPYVIQDYVFGVRAAMETMIRGGARRIVYVRDPLWAAGNPIYRTMEEACEQVRADLPAAAGGWIVDSPHALPPVEGKRLWFDGVFCANDQVACLTVGLLTERGIAVPEQVQVIGYGNSDLSRFFTPQISTVCPHLPRMCRLVCDIMARYRTGGQVETLQHVMMPQVIERDTTNRAREARRTIDIA